VRKIKHSFKVLEVHLLEDNSAQREEQHWKNQLYTY